MTESSQHLATVESHWERIAKRKAGIDGWQWFAVEVIGRPTGKGEADRLVEGGVPTIVSRGKNKGQRRWDRKTATRVVVTGDEIRAECERYEREEQKCERCYGLGQVLASWSATGGWTSRSCGKCAGTGRPAAQPDTNRTDCAR